MLQTAKPIWPENPTIAAPYIQIITNGTNEIPKPPPVYIGVDTETSGLDCDKHGLLQIGAAATSATGFLLDVFKYDVDPGFVEFDEKALEINGFTSDRIRLAPRRGLVAKEFGKWLDSFGNVILVFHNAPFDVAFLQQAFRAEGVPLDHFRRVRDTATMSPDVYGESNYPRSLKNICEKLGIVNAKEHDAFADAYATIQVFHRMRQILDDRRQPKNTAPGYIARGILH